MAKRMFACYFCEMVGTVEGTSDDEEVLLEEAKQKHLPEAKSVGIRCVSEEVFLVPMWLLRGILIPIRDSIREVHEAGAQRENRMIFEVLAPLVNKSKYLK